MSQAEVRQVCHTSAYSIHTTRLPIRVVYCRILVERCPAYGAVKSQYCRGFLAIESVRYSEKVISHVVNASVAIIITLIFFVYRLCFASPEKS